MSTYKNKQKSTQLKSFLLHFWPSILKTDHLCEFNFLALLKFRKYKTTNKTLLTHFPCCLSCGGTTHHSPDMNRKVRGTRFIQQPCPKHCVFCVSSGCKLDRNDTGIRVHSTHNSAFYKFTQHMLTLRNVLLLRKVA